MFPWPREWPRYLAGAVVVVFVFKNPTAEPRANAAGGRSTSTD
jgi:hypothetical protein